MPETEVDYQPLATPDPMSRMLSQQAGLLGLGLAEAREKFRPSNWSIPGFVRAPYEAAKKILGGTDLEGVSGRDVFSLGSVTTPGLVRAVSGRAVGELGMAGGAVAPHLEKAVAKLKEATQRVANIQEKVRELEALAQKAGPNMPADMQRQHDALMHGYARDIERYQKFTQDAYKIIKELNGGRDFELGTMGGTGRQVPPTGPVRSAVTRDMREYLNRIDVPNEAGKWPNRKVVVNAFRKRFPDVQMSDLGLHNVISRERTQRMLRAQETPAPRSMEAAVAAAAPSPARISVDDVKRVASELGLGMRERVTGGGTTYLEVFDRANRNRRMTVRVPHPADPHAGAPRQWNVDTSRVGSREHTNWQYNIAGEAYENNLPALRERLAYAFGRSPPRETPWPPPQQPQPDPNQLRLLSGGVPATGAEPKQGDEWQRLNSALKGSRTASAVYDTRTVEPWYLPISPVEREALEPAGRPTLEVPPPVPWPSHAPATWGGNWMRGDPGTGSVSQPRERQLRDLLREIDRQPGLPQ